MVMTTPTFDRHDWYISREVDGEQKEILDSMSMGMSMRKCTIKTEHDAAWSLRGCVTVLLQSQLKTK
ncbi:hypothetical protein MY11210_003548 [Beauveria gryllotalpidicola]